MAERETEALRAVLALRGVVLPDALAAGAEANHAELQRECAIVRTGLAPSVEPAFRFDPNATIAIGSAHDD